jgi:hypothetical protein
MKKRRVFFFKKILKTAKKKFKFWPNFQLRFYVNDVYLGRAN